MHPYLFDLAIQGHHLRPPTYGVLLALAFSTGYFLALKRSIKLGESPKHIENLFLICVLCTVVGARLFHVLFEEFDYYLQNPAKIFAVWEGGYTLYGAMILGIIGFYLYAQWRKIDFLQYFDIVTPPTMLGIAIGRVGCFFAGCCWGMPTQVPWAVTFTDPESFTKFKNVPIHPTQLYEAAGTFLIFFFLNRYFDKRKFEGQIFFLGLSAYALVRFIVELFRGDAYRGFILDGLLSYSQVVSLLIIPFCILGHILFAPSPKK